MKTYCNVCNKYRKSKKTKILYVFKKTLSLSIVYRKCGRKYERYLSRRINRNIKKSWSN